VGIHPSHDDERRRVVKKSLVLCGVIALVIAVIVFVFASGARRIYSGIFFAVLGIVLLSQARGSSKPTSS
jgi:hypothetical protein